MIETRPATPADEPFLLSLTERLADFPVPPWRTPGEIGAADHDILVAALHQPGPANAILVAEDTTGVPLGYVFASSRTDYFTGARQAHIEVLAVSPQAEGKGVARMLLGAVERWAAETGRRTVTLNVFMANARARGLYDHLGYQPELVSYRKDV